MSDNNKFDLNVRYVQLNINKHALEFYLTRESTEEDKEKERKLQDKVNEKIGFVKTKNCILTVEEYNKKAYEKNVEKREKKPRKYKEKNIGYYSGYYDQLRQ